MGDDVTDFRYGLTAVGEFCLCGERFSFQVLHAVFCESGLSGLGDLLTRLILSLNINYAFN